MTEGALTEMPIPVLAWTTVIVFLARILHLRLSFAAPGMTLTVPVPMIVVGLLVAAIAAGIILIARSLLQPGVARA